MRDLCNVIDEPVECGGSNLGLSPTETFVAALIGCTSVISHKIAHKNGITLQHMQVRVEAHFNRRRVTLSEEVAVPFPAMTPFIDVRSDASPELIKQLQHELAMYCRFPNSFAPRRLSGSGPRWARKGAQPRRKAQRYP